MFTQRLAFMACAILVLGACRSMQSVQFSDALQKDAVFITGAVNLDSRLAGIRTLGGYTIEMFGANDFAKQRVGAVSINDASNKMAFNICKNGNCATAEANYYMRTKKRSLNVISRNGTEKILSHRISGYVNYLGDTPGFNVDLQKGGTGSLHLTTGIVTIRPVSRKTKYLKTPHGVALEYVMNNEVIGSFRQQDENISIALKNNLSEKNKTILTAVSICLMNKSDMVKIL